MKFLSEFLWFSPIHASHFCFIPFNYFSYSFHNRKAPRVIYKLASDCGQLLRTWKKSYMDTRTFIENFTTDPRWEFDKILLFNESDHSARISQDVADIAKVSFEVYHDII